MFGSLKFHHQGPKQLGVDVLNHYCDSNEGCVFVGLHRDKWKVMHGMENVRKKCQFSCACIQGTVYRKCGFVVGTAEFSSW